jgi:hypothetical protein
MRRSKIAFGAAAVVAAALPAIAPVSGAHASPPRLSGPQFHLSPAAVAKIKGRTVSPRSQLWDQIIYPGPQSRSDPPPLRRPSVRGTIKRFGK